MQMPLVPICPEDVNLLLLFRSIYISAAGAGAGVTFLIMGYF